MPIPVPTGRKSPPLIVDEDEHPRPESTFEKLSGLKPLHRCLAGHRRGDRAHLKAFYHQPADLIGPRCCEESTVQRKTATFRSPVGRNAQRFRHSPHAWRSYQAEPLRVPPYVLSAEGEAASP